MSVIRRIRGILIGVLVGIVPVVAPAAAEQWELSGVSTIRLDGVSGDVIVRPADGGPGWIELRADVYPADAFEARVERRGSTLRIKEEWSGSSQGEVEWTIHIGDGGPEIRVETASGSLDSRDVALDIEFQSASGSIELTNVDIGPNSDLSTASGDYRIRDMTVREGVRFRTASGDVHLENVEVQEGVSFSSASGDVEARGCTGHLRLKSASGDVVVRDSAIVGEGKFSSASGDVSLYLDQVPNEGLSASSASGSVLLDAGGLGGSYTLVLVADLDEGRIDCPFDVTSKRTFERNRRQYQEMRVERGPGGPEIELETASGSVIVRN